MQEIHSITGGRFFGGGGGGERRLRPHHHHQNHQALKCPRCDSLNTKFCYYNNYNLSQPRHFCKNCRRYWTKGGVLRNVPVGGGCRKSKRSNNKPAKNNSSSSSETATATTTSTTQPATEPQRKSNSHSSSESSSLTAAAAAASTAMETTSNSGSNNKLLDNNNFHEAKLFSNPAGFELEQGEGGGDCSIYSEIGSFTSLITCSSSNEALGFGFGNNIFDASPFRFSAQRGTDLHPHAQCQWQQQKVVSINSDHHTHLDHQDMKFPDITGSLLDQTVPVGHGGFGSLDWHDGADQGLFDLPNTVDQPYNWTHSIHWSDQANPSTLFHLP